MGTDLEKLEAFIVSSGVRAARFVLQREGDREQIRSWPGGADVRAGELAASVLDVATDETRARVERWQLFAFDVASDSLGRVTFCAYAAAALAALGAPGSAGAPGLPAPGARDPIQSMPDLISRIVGRDLDFTEQAWRLTVHSAADSLADMRAENQSLRAHIRKLESKHFEVLELTQKLMLEDTQREISRRTALRADERQAFAFAQFSKFLPHLMSKASAAMGITDTESERFLKLLDGLNDEQRAAIFGALSDEQRKELFEVIATLSGAKEKEAAAAAAQNNNGGGVTHGPS